MEVNELVRKTRSYRRFDSGHKVSLPTLEELVDLARLSPSAANRQPLKYILSSTEEENQKIFPTLAWAGYIEQWTEPAPAERPTAYIVVLGDNEIAESFEYDAGIAAQSILLGATERGLGGCIIGALDKESLRSQLALSERYEIQFVIALGKPAEEVVIDEGGEEKVKYYRDQDDVHHVPKRSLDEIILKPGDY